MDLYSTLVYLYPNEDHAMGIVVRDNEIVEWNLDLVQPTTTELEQAHLVVARKQKIDEMAECALDEIRSLFRTSLPSYEVLGIHNAKLLANNSEDYPPRYTAAMELIRDTNMKLEQKLYEVSLSENPETVTWN